MQYIEAKVQRTTEQQENTRTGQQDNKTTEQSSRVEDASVYRLHKQDCRKIQTICKTC